MTIQEVTSTPPDSAQSPSPITAEYTLEPLPTRNSNDSPPEIVQKITTFNNISEENENATAPESDIDDVDFVSKLQRLIPTDDDRKEIVSPTNGSVNSKTYQDQRSVKLVTIDSGSLPRNNKVHPALRQSASNDGVSMQPNQIPVLSFASKPKLQRPLSTDVQRTISAIEAERLSHLTHRRTQSYAASTTLNRLQNNGHDMSRRPSKGISSLRSAGSVTNMREYYAAPSFIEASLIERQESIRRRNDLKTVVE